MTILKDLFPPSKIILAECLSRISYSSLGHGTIENSVYTLVS